MTVIKRSGREEEFDIGKMKIALECASDSINQPMNSGDINMICKAAMHEFEGKDKITSKEIYSALVKTLIENRFNAVVKAYIESEKNYWE